MEVQQLRCRCQNWQRSKRLAMKAILGCYITTPMAAMEIENGLQPLRTQLQTKGPLATTRMQSLSPRHPTQKWLMNVLRTRIAGIRYRSTLESILQQFPYTCSKNRDNRGIYSTFMVDADCKNYKTWCQRPTRQNPNALKPHNSNNIHGRLGH